MISANGKLKHQSSIGGRTGAPLSNSFVLGLLGVLRRHGLVIPGQHVVCQSHKPHAAGYAPVLDVYVATVLNDPYSRQALPDTGKVLPALKAKTSKTARITAL